MANFNDLIHSKKFWVLIAAIVTALTAFFTSCTASAKVHREGVHIDTVRVDYIIRSRNIQDI